MNARKIVRNRRKMDEKGVSPVIGVILMVAATIVIAAVVMGMLGGFTPPKKAYSVAVTASKTPEEKVKLTFVGGPDASLVQSFSGKIINLSSNPNPTEETISGLTNTVGDTMTSTNSYPDGAHVVVYATFKDGTKQVVLDTYV